MSDLRGREVHGNNQQIDEIDEVIIQPRDHTAAALLDPNDDFAGTDQNYIVPINKLQDITPEDGPLGTTLTRQDFARAGQTSDSTWATPDGYISSLYVWPVFGLNTSDTQDGQQAGMDPQSRRDKDQPFASSDRVSSRQRQSDSQTDTGGMRQSQQPPVEAVQRAVQSASTGAQQSIRVSAEQDKLVLGGTVPSEAVKERIEQRAEDAAEGWDVESEIRVASTR